MDGCVTQAETNAILRTHEYTQNVSINHTSSTTMPREKRSRAVMAEVEWSASASEAWMIRDTLTATRDKR